MARRQQNEPRTAYGRRMATRAEDHRIAATANLRTAGLAAAAGGLAVGTGNLPVGGGLLSLAAVTTDAGLGHKTQQRRNSVKGRAVEDLISRAQGWNLRANVERHNEPVRSSRQVLGASETVPSIRSVSPMARNSMPQVMDQHPRQDVADTFNNITLMSEPDRNWLGSRSVDRVQGQYGRATQALGNTMARQHEIRRDVRTRSEVKGAKQVGPSSSSTAPIGTPGVDSLAYTSNAASTIAGSQMARTVRKGGVVDQAVGDAKGVASGAKARGTRKATPAAPSVVNRAMRGVAAANPLMMATAGAVMASNAFNAAKAAGGSNLHAAGAAGLAASPMGVAAIAPTVLGRYAPTVASGLAKAALPLLAVSTGIAAVRGGLNAYQQGVGAAGVVKGAAIGAADSLTFGLASAVRDRMTGRTPGPDKAVAAQQMQSDMGAADHTGAYLDDSARSKAESAAPPIRAPMAGRAVAPSSDGQTEGYERTDPRTGMSVRVEGYKTPTRRAA